VHGASGYFDGSDYTQTPNTPQFQINGSDEYTISAWVYNQGSGTHRGICGARLNGNANGWCLYIHPDNSLYIGSIIIGSGYVDRKMHTAVIAPNTWNHVALVKTSAGYRGYVNGVGGTLLAMTNGFDYQPAQQMTVGALGSGGEFPFLGYIADFQFVRGQALYTADFAVPTAPQVATNSNQKLLLNFANAGLYDSTGKIVVETVGNARASSGNFRFGPASSISFDNSVASFLRMPAGCFNFGTSDFTIDLWYFKTAQPGASGRIFQTADGDALTGISITDNSGTLTLNMSYTGGAWDIGVAGIAMILNSWHHITLRRCGGTVNMFLNGVVVTTSAIGTNPVFYNATQTPVIGGQTTPNRSLIGYLDDFRITIGKARYTVEPTANLKTK
jgi:hypothetical protein